MKNTLYICLLLLISCTPKGAEQLQSNQPKTPVPVVSVPKVVETPDEMAPEEPENPPPYLVAVLKKTTCYGICPVFEARLFSDGHLTYFGEQDVELLGHFEAWNGTELVAKIKNEAYRQGYFQLSDTYPGNGPTMEDFPMTITYLNFDDQEKTIINNYESPKALRRFEDFLEGLFSKVAWRKMDSGS